ncbi:MAG: uracil phosphoribosyltransferase [bacterium]
MINSNLSSLKNLLITKLRNKNTSRAEFRYTSMQLAGLLALEAESIIETKKIDIETPITTTTGLQIKKNIILIPILRSGLALLPAFIKQFPDCAVGVVGMKRDEKTAIAHLYYKNIPQISTTDQVIILDPMIATGGSGTATIKIVTDTGIDQKQIIFVGIIAAPEGIKVMKKAYPDIKIIVAITDEGLTSNKFITPGLGDFGDRFFGTE